MIGFKKIIVQIIFLQFIIIYLTRANAVILPGVSLGDGCIVGAAVASTASYTLTFFVSVWFYLSVSRFSNATG